MMPPHLTCSYVLYTCFYVLTTDSYGRRLDIGGRRSSLTGLSGLAPEGGGRVEQVVDVADHDGREVDHVQDVLKLLRRLHL